MMGIGMSTQGWGEREPVVSSLKSLSISKMMSTSLTLEQPKGDLWIASNLLPTKKDSSYVVAPGADTSLSPSTAQKACTPVWLPSVSESGPTMLISYAHITSMYQVTPLAETLALIRRCKGVLRKQIGRGEKLRKLKQNVWGLKLKPKLRSSVRDLKPKMRPSVRESRKKKLNVYDSKKSKLRGNEWLKKIGWDKRQRMPRGKDSMNRRKRKRGGSRKNIERRLRLRKKLWDWLLNRRRVNALSVRGYYLRANRTKRVSMTRNLESLHLLPHQNQSIQPIELECIIITV
jgi:hypothetical protein